MLPQHEHRRRDRKAAERPFSSLTVQSRLSRLRGILGYEVTSPILYYPATAIARLPFPSPLGFGQPTRLMSMRSVFLRGLTRSPAACFPELKSRSGSVRTEVEFSVSYLRSYSAR